MHKFALSCASAALLCVLSCSNQSGSGDKTDSTAQGGEGPQGGEGGNEPGGSGGTQDGPPGGAGASAAASGGAGGANDAKGGAAGMATSNGGSPMTGSGGARSGGSGGGTTMGGGPVAAACASLTNCDPFESYATGSRPGGAWTAFEVAGGSLLVDEAHAYGGSKKAVKISVNPGGDMTARMRHAGQGLLPAQELYMRMMVWMDAAPKGAGHWNWMWGEGNVSQASGGKLSSAFVASGGNLSGGKTWMLYGGGASGGYQDCFASAQTSLPVGRWACYEFHLDAKTNTGEAWVDGKPDDLLSFADAQSLTGQCLPGHNFTNGLWYVPKIEKVFFGFKMYHTLDATATAWLDDIAISNKRIGCPASP